VSYIQSGEAIPLDITDFLQFIPFGTGAGAAIKAGVKPLSGIFAPIIRQAESAAIKTASKEVAPIFTSTSKGITSTLKKLIFPTVATGAITTASTIPKQVTQVLTSKGLSTVAKIGVATIPPTIATGLLTLTPTGQQLSKDIGQTGVNLSDFVKNQGQLLSIFLIIGGVALLVGALKK